MIPVYDAQVDVGQPADLFHAFVPYDTGLLCFFRRHIISSSRSGASALWMAEWNGVGLVNQRCILDACEDPRVIRHGDHVLVFTIHLDSARGYHYLIYSHPSGEVCDVTLPGGLVCGKNWQPVSDGDRIRIVHSFSPMRWLDLDIASGHAREAESISIGLDAIAPHDGYTMYRGGSNAIRNNGSYHGAGHVTHRPDRHLPFLWDYTPAHNRVAIRMLNLPPELLAFGVVDPTSLWENSSGRWLAITCSERDWFYAQRFASYILRLPA